MQDGLIGLAWLAVPWYPVAVHHAGWVHGLGWPWANFFFGPTFNLASYNTRNGTERNGTKRNETKWKRASKGWTLVRLQGQMRLGGLQAGKQDTECTLAGLNPMLRQRDPAARLSFSRSYQQGYPARHNVHVHQPRYKTVTD